MESLLIFIVIIVIDALVKRANAKKKAEQQQHHAPTTDSTQEFEDNRNDENSDESVPPEPSPVARKLQEYIKQFEQAQQEAAQGTLEPAMPPPVPPSTHRRGNNVTLREVVEVIVEFDVVNADFLMEEFGMSRNAAGVMLEELEHFRIIGHDMGVGEHDVLIQDISELDNLLSHPPVAAPAKAAASKQAPSVSPAVSEKQNQLKILEERARKAREEADAIAQQNDAENGYTDEPVEVAESFNKRTTIRSISKEFVRRGFIWAKIIDEPRFKKRWSPATR